MLRNNQNDSINPRIHGIYSVCKVSDGHELRCPIPWIYWKPTCLSLSAYRKWTSVISGFISLRIGCSCVHSICHTSELGYLIILCVFCDFVRPLEMTKILFCFACVTLFIVLANASSKVKTKNWHSNGVSKFLFLFDFKIPRLKLIHLENKVAV